MVVMQLPARPTCLGDILAWAVSALASCAQATS